MEHITELVLVAWLAIWFIKYIVVEYGNFRLYMQSVYEFGGISEEAYSTWRFIVYMHLLYVVVTFIKTPISLTENHVFMFVKKDPKDIVEQAYDEVNVADKN